jgi:hypothetical protein
MWSGFDPEFVRQLGVIRQMVTLRYQSPTREWPLMFLEDLNELLVVREWPDGTLTAYLRSTNARETPKDRI